MTEQEWEDDYQRVFEEDMKRRMYAECDAEDAQDNDDYQPSTCPHCNGTGIDVWTGLEECEYCDGMGYKWWE